MQHHEIRVGTGPPNSTPGADGVKTTQGRSRIVPASPKYLFQSVS
jgi:hypothetical protein